MALQNWMLIMDHVSSWLKNWYTLFTELVHPDYRTGTARLPNWYTVVTEIWYTVGYRLQMHARMQTTKGKRMMQVRKSTVEPVLGTLVNFLGLRQINTKGIEQAGKCMLIAALAYNLKKLLKFHTPKVEVATQSLRKTLQRAPDIAFLQFWTPTAR